MNGKAVRMYVHRLILFAFKGLPPHPKYISRHLNGNPKDNRPENLEWGTYQDNYDDAVKHGTKCKRKEPKLTDIKILKIKQKKEILIRTNVHLSTDNRTYLKKAAKRFETTPAALLRHMIESLERDGK